MSAQPINWYETNLEHSKATLQQEKDKLSQVQRMVHRLETQIEFLEHQIAQAKAKGKESFDEDRFLVPKEAQKIGINKWLENGGFRQKR